jgi:hypothetical protein
MRWWTFSVRLVRHVCLAACLTLVAAGAGTAASDAVKPVIVVFGDSQAQGIASALQRSQLHDPHYKIIDRTHPGAALAHKEVEWLTPIKEFTEAAKADYAVVMFGANDRLDMRLGEPARVTRFRSEAWRQVYGSRIDAALTPRVAAGVRIVWCGNPIARAEGYAADMQFINQIAEEHAEKLGVQYLSLWQIVADADGTFVANGKALDGVTRRLRTDDGIHFTPAGYDIVVQRLLGLIDAGSATKTSSLGSGG